MIKRIFTLMVAMLFLNLTTALAAEDATNSYTYISRDYNFSILCPARPNVVPATIFFDDENIKGEVLIFENEGYEVKRGWAVVVDAFRTDAVPDFNNESKEVIDKYLTDLQKNGYEGTALIDITNTNKGVLAITAKEIEIDEDDDGQPDATLTTDHQEAVTFFRSSDGRSFSIQLIGSNDINDAAMNNFRRALSTFSTDNLSNQNSQNEKKDDKKSKGKKDKNNKKSKKK